MGEKTGIQWTDSTWPIVNGCNRISAGCGTGTAGGCYAERLIATRLSKQPKYAGLAEMKNGKPRWTGEMRIWEPHLTLPLKWRDPRKIFVANMGDLFHDDVPDDWIDRVHAVIAISQYVGRCRRRECDHENFRCWDQRLEPPKHTYQVVTKRAERMRLYYTSPDRIERVRAAADAVGWTFTPNALSEMTWPLPRLWLGVSVEDQKTANRRIPQLIQTPAAVRFVSYEPALEAVNFRAIEHWHASYSMAELERTGWYEKLGLPEEPERIDALTGSMRDGEEMFRDLHRGAYPRLDWIILGGESGPGARPFWVPSGRKIVEQCRAARVPLFFKQMGSNVQDRNDAGFDGCEPHYWPVEIEERDAIEHELDGTRDGYQGAPVRIHLLDHKGGDMNEWPEDLRVRQFPEAGRE